MSKQTNSWKKGSDLLLPEAEGRERGNRMKAVKMYQLSVIRQISTRDVMCNVINLINTAVHCI